jgi:hypothetical protein
MGVILSLDTIAKMQIKRRSILFATDPTWPRDSGSYPASYQYNSKTDDEQDM